MALTVKQKAFIAAYLGSAHRNAVAAAIMAGITRSRAEALALVEHPEIRAELERRNMHAVVIDGQLLDVAPGPLKNTSRKKKGVREMRKAKNEKFSLKEKLQQRKKMREDLSNIDAIVLTEDGRIAGSLEENAARLESIVTHDAHLKSIKGSSPQLVDRLAKRFDDTGREGIAYPTVDGGVAVTTRVKTRFEIKQWLSRLMDDATYEIGVRMQAAALLGKSLGLFSEKVISDEYRHETEVKDASMAELREAIANQRARLARLKAPRSDVDDSGVGG